MYYVLEAKDMLKEKNENDKIPMKKIVAKKHDKILDDAVAAYEKALDHGKRMSKETVAKIEKTTKTGTDLFNSQQYWESIKRGSQKIKEQGIKQEKKIKKQSPKFYRKFANGFFKFFEVLVGRIKIGTQYGTPSLDLLERLAKLHELGILTDEEFNKEKKKILDRL